tara:strand:- start:17781 stop:18746 length:966 start_codon:yes stop_codon:yes gene_type:complete
LGYDIKNILITGGFGYIGAQISQFLALKGYKVTIFGREKPEFGPNLFSENIIFMEGDIQNELCLKDVTKKKYNIIIHLISLNQINSNNNADYISSINIMPTWKLLEIFSAKGLEKFIYFSTTQVYGKLISGNITEDKIIKPLNKYGLTHAISENIVNFFNDNFKVQCINVRLSNSYGSPLIEKHNYWGLVINDFCNSIFNSNIIDIKSDGSPLRDFIHLDDVLDGILMIIKYKGSLEKNTFNLSSGETITILEAAKVVKKVFWNKYKKESSIKIHEEVELIKNNNSRYIISNRRIKKIGFKKKITLINGINKLFNYLESKK